MGTVASDVPVLWFAIGVFAVVGFELIPHWATNVLANCVSCRDIHQSRHSLAELPIGIFGFEPTIHSRPKNVSILRGEKIEEMGGATLEHISEGVDQKPWEGCNHSSGDWLPFVHGLEKIRHKPLTRHKAEGLFHCIFIGIRH